jgi:tRNA-dihydrouridine synthase 2
VFFSANDFVAVDLNMGCPKHFSVQGGMGAALLRDGGETAVAILSALVREFPHLSISCKIRLLATVDDTVALLRRLEATGVWCIAVHAREAHERPEDRAHWSTVRQVVDAGQFDVPIVINGDVFEREHIEQACVKSGCNAAMVARGALRNASLFGPQAVSNREFWRAYVRLAMEFEASAVNIKYTVLRMIGESPRRRGTTEADECNDTMTQIRSTKTVLGICEALSLVDEFQALDAARNGKRIEPCEPNTGEPDKRPRVDDVKP